MLPVRPHDLFGSVVRHGPLVVHLLRSVRHEVFVAV
jgi:hypothetical protein